MKRPRTFMKVRGRSPSLVTASRRPARYGAPIDFNAAMPDGGKLRYPGAAARRNQLRSLRLSADILPLFRSETSSKPTF
jgi:hypothetical protein